MEIDPNRLTASLEETAATLTGEDLILDFSAVDRVDTASLAALEKLAVQSQEKSVKVTLSGVNVTVYKVLKLMRLTAHFAFSN